MNSAAGAPRAGWARGLVCSATGETASLASPAFLSPAGAPWLVDYELDPRRAAAWRTRLAARPWTLWRYHELLPVERLEDRIDLGEGGTPLVALRRLSPPGVEVLVKEESGNPTGSFKARGLSLAVNRARELGAPGVQLPSAGNAALALAAYAAAAGLPCRVAVPEGTPRTVTRRCREHGAEVIVGGATLVESARALERAGGGFWLLSTLREPYRLEGKKTMGLELAEQLGWRVPDWVVYPTGGGTGLIGMAKGFDELRRLGMLSAAGPRFAAVQMEGCAPIVRAFEAGRKRAEPWGEARTRVWGLRVPAAIGDFLILRTLRKSGGTAVAIGEAEIVEMQQLCARREGLLVGPEGAAAMAAVQRLAKSGHIRPGERVVVFQTGHPANYE